MLTLATVRLGLIVAAVVAFMGLIWFVFDAIGDAREAKVWAKVEETINDTNDKTKVANEQDAEKRALHERLRTSALLAAAKTKGMACLLTAEEALVIGAIK